ncbi:MAG: Nif3-like dinuclear metal center hexameric protein [Lentisphaerae bacterium]|nr:Nif3-like dinuclear metal center hexameric protein [Lentisphaerota bacterium]
MTTLKNLVEFLDQELKLNDYSGDYSNNGLQIEGKPEIRKAVFGVDACQALFDAAIARNADFIFTHHGISWGGEPRLWTGITAKRFSALFKNSVSLYGAHLPLDANEHFGNNRVLADIAELSELTKTCRYAGVDIGFCGSNRKNLTVKDIANRYASALPKAPVIYGNSTLVPGKAVVVSGGGGMDALNAAVSSGAELLITGEMEHIMYHPALENNITIISLGHYSSETTGPKAVCDLVAKNFDIETEFIDIYVDL